jgi:hypothetical protein
MFYPYSNSNKINHGTKILQKKNNNKELKKNRAHMSCWLKTEYKIDFKIHY